MLTHKTWMNNQKPKKQHQKRKRKKQTWIDQRLDCQTAYNDIKSAPKDCKSYPN